MASGNPLHGGARGGDGNHSKRLPTRTRSLAEETAREDTGHRLQYLLYSTSEAFKLPQTIFREEEMKHIWSEVRGANITNVLRRTGTNVRDEKFASEYHKKQLKEHITIRVKVRI